jgi:hypothetical protein
MPNNTSQPAYFAVLQGRKPGIYLNWADCEQNIKGFPGAMYNIFHSFDQAHDFLNHPFNAGPINDGLLIKQQMSVEDIQLSTANSIMSADQTPNSKKETMPVVFATQELGASSMFNKRGSLFLPKRVKRSRSVENEDDKRRIKLLTTTNKPQHIVVDVSSQDDDSDDTSKTPSKPTIVPPTAIVSKDATVGKKLTKNSKLESSQKDETASSTTTILNDASIHSTITSKVKTPENTMVTNQQPENLQPGDPQKATIDIASTTSSTIMKEDALSIALSITSPTIAMISKRTAVPKQRPEEDSQSKPEKDIVNIATATTSTSIVSDPEITISDASSNSEVPEQMVEENEDEDENNGQLHQEPNNVESETNHYKQRIAPEKLIDIDQLLKRVRTSPTVSSPPKETNTLNWEDDYRQDLEERKGVGLADFSQHRIFMEGGARKLDKLVQFHLVNDETLQKQPRQQEEMEQLGKSQAEQEEFDQRLEVWKRKNYLQKQVQEHKLRGQQEQLHRNQNQVNVFSSSKSCNQEESKPSHNEFMITNADDDTVEEDKLTDDDITTTIDQTTTAVEEDKITITNTDDDTTTNYYITAEQDIMTLEEDTSSFDNYTKTGYHKPTTHTKNHDSSTIMKSNTTSLSLSQSILSVKESLQQRVKDLKEVKKEANATVIQVMTWLKECAENDWITAEGESLNDNDLEEIMLEVVEIRKSQK